MPDGLPEPSNDCCGQHAAWREVPRTSTPQRGWTGTGRATYPMIYRYWFAGCQHLDWNQWM